MKDDHDTLELLEGFPPEPLAEGSRVSIAGKAYDLKYMLGQGAYGCVYAAAQNCSEDCEEQGRGQLDSGQEKVAVAIKEVRCGAGLGLPDMTRDRLYFELQCLRNIPQSPSPGAPRLLGATCFTNLPGFGHDAAILRFVMTKMPGDPLADSSLRRTKDTALSPSRNALQISVRMLCQMSELFSHVADHLVHRDINGRNILFERPPDISDNNVNMNDKNNVLEQSPCPEQDADTNKSEREIKPPSFCLVDFGSAIDTRTFAESWDKLPPTGES
eukprot:GSA25T00023799001.1